MESDGRPDCPHYAEMFSNMWVTVGPIFNRKTNPARLNGKAANMIVVTELRDEAGTPEPVAFTYCTLLNRLAYSASMATAIPSTSEGASTALRSDEFWNFLNDEISHFRKQQERPGWTRWAVLGALASLLWLLSKEIQGQPLEWQYVLEHFLLFSLVADLFERLSAWLAPETNGKPDSPRFFLTRMFQDNRAVVLAEGLRCLCLGLLACVFVQEMWMRVGVLFFYGFLFLAMVLGFVSSYFDLPVGPAIRERKHLDIAGIFLFCCGLAGAIGLIGNSSALSIEALAGSFRAAGLIWGTVYLLSLLAQSDANHPMLRTLGEIRRDYAFGRIDQRTAAAKADIALAGMRVSDLFQEDLEKLLLLVNTIVALRDKERSIYQNVRQHLPTGDRFDSDRTRNLQVIDSLITLSGSTTREALKLLDQLEKGVDKLISKATLIKVIEPKGSADINKVLEGLQAEIKLLKSRSKSIQTEIEQTESDLATYRLNCRGEDDSLPSSTVLK